ncbi:MAG: hypothetical protein M3362_28045 [Acidobacteriota bacterium]|nr:hypothetical protein [Acidobacteriota bacterium]
MDDLTTRKYEAFLRVRELGNTYKNSIPAGNVAADLLDRLDTIIEEMRTHASTQASKMSTALQGGKNKRDGREELQRRLASMTQTAKSMDFTTPGVAEKFRAPRKLKDQDLITIARSFAADAVPLKSDFIKRGLPATFLEDLNREIEEFSRGYKPEDSKPRVAGGINGCY